LTALVELERLIKLALSEDGGKEIPSPPATPADFSAAGKLTEALNKLVPSINQAVAVQPERQAELLNQVAAIRKAIQEGETDTARTRLLETGRLVKQLVAASAVTDAPATVRQVEAFSQAEWEKAKRVWQDAIETVDGQISRLQSALRRSDDQELEGIAEFGLHGVTANLKIPLMAAMRDIDEAVGEPQERAITRARTAVAKFRKHLARDERVEVCDENPFDIKVTIRKTLGGALEELKRTLGT
jgi:hypothetical protein